jgi:hypothetical protein
MITSFLYYQIQVPKVIEKRMKSLDLMEYDSKSDKFIMKDSILINSGDLNYIKYGTTNY